MMEEKQETSADIIAEIRARAKAWPEPSLVQYDERLADRLEAVLKREKAEIEAEALAAGGIVEAGRHTPGNAAAMREALVALTDKVIDYLQKGLIQLPLPLEEATAKARAVLSAPPRNCDVGSVKEQYSRFCICCTEHKMPCRRSYTFGCAECYANWAQMPYEAKKGGAE